MLREDLSTGQQHESQQLQSQHSRHLFDRWTAGNRSNEFSPVHLRARLPFDRVTQLGTGSRSKNNFSTFQLLPLLHRMRGETPGWLSTSLGLEYSRCFRKDAKSAAFWYVRCTCTLTALDRYFIFSLIFKLCASNEIVFNNAELITVHLIKKNILVLELNYNTCNTVKGTYHVQNFYSIWRFLGLRLYTIVLVRWISRRDEVK